MLSIAYIYFVFKGIIAVPKAMCVMNTIGSYIIFHFFGSILTGITGNGIFKLSAGLGASLGVGLMFIAVCFACNRSEIGTERKNIRV